MAKGHILLFFKPSRLQDIRVEIQGREMILQCFGPTDQLHEPLSRSSSSWGRNLPL